MDEHDVLFFAFRGDIFFFLGIQKDSRQNESRQITLVGMT